MARTGDQTLIGGSPPAYTIRIHHPYANEIGVLYFLKLVMGNEVRLNVLRNVEMEAPLRVD
jgi:hypothetical protein